jgi:hypothetical protein
MVAEQAVVGGRKQGVPAWDLVANQRRGVALDLPADPLEVAGTADAGLRERLESGPSVVLVAIVRQDAGGLRTLVAGRIARLPERAVQQRGRAPLQILHAPAEDAAQMLVEAAGTVRRDWCRERRLRSHLVLIAWSTGSGTLGDPRRGPGPQEIDEIVPAADVLPEHARAHGIDLARRIEAPGDDRAIPEALLLEQGLGGHRCAGAGDPGAGERLGAPELCERALAAPLGPRLAAPPIRALAAPVEAVETADGGGDVRSYQTGARTSHPA